MACSACRCSFGVNSRATAGSAHEARANEEIRSAWARLMSRCAHGEEQRAE
eukprot:CAMPEP_0184401600 /NCGR_PEP_ID=MMETSP0007-20130409/79596_1 /TAXON_ID=97485 /ORGANISM="Prymnesium parvum, Strain Texoma1" /LENGTH=50 /DNA_ID=CAMNT_0026757043 /DNA_START=94 /DNA_END=243 /DNA_ORIENTATION=-